MSDIKLVLDDGRTYFRFSNTYAETIKTKLKEQYCSNNDIDNMQVAITSSGMQAISSVMNVVMSNWGWSSNSCMVLGDEMYCDTPRAALHHSKFYTGNNMFIHRVKIDDNDKLLNLFRYKLRDNNVLLMIEACSNPNGDLFDFSIIKELKKLCKSLIVIVDITWTPELNALELGADAIALSLTKHHSGSSCIMGAIISRRNPGIAEEVNQWFRLTGGHISPYDSSKLLSMLSSFTERIDSAFNEAIKLANLLESKSWVSEVNYPLLKSHKSYNLATKYNIRPTVLHVLVDIPGSKREVDRLLKSRKYLRWATSYGGHESRIDPWYKSISGTTKYWVRLSVGYKSRAEDIINDIENML